MTDEEVLKLSMYLSQRDKTCVDQFQTHISWVILSGKYAYKIKKPVKTTFLDFGTLSKRKALIKKELFLNKRLASEVYVNVCPIKFSENEIFTGNNKKGRIIDYALLMKKLDNDKRMDVRLKLGKVSKADIKRVALKLATFHARAKLFKPKRYTSTLLNTYYDLQNIVNLAERFLGKKYLKLISDSLEKNNAFIDNNKSIFQTRVKEGYIRDVHGDLHAANIFLYKDPVIYDCIEFNDSFRRIDLLNEAAFICMDLDKWERRDLSELFMKEYLKVMKWKLSADEWNLFNYYKSLRANIRGKVSLIRLSQLRDKNEIINEMKSAKKYLQLMANYLNYIK